MKLNLSNPSLRVQSFIMLTAVGLMSGCASDGATNTTAMTQTDNHSPVMNQTINDQPTEQSTDAIAPSRFPSLDDQIAQTSQVDTATPDKISTPSPITATSTQKESTPMTTMVIENTELMAKGISNSNALQATTPAITAPNSSVTPVSAPSSQVTQPNTGNTSATKVTTLAKTDQLMLDKIIRPQKRVFHYATNQKNLSNEDIQILKQHAKYLLQNPTLSLNINGYTDARGSEKANLKLSEQRAEEVMHQLETMGVDKSRLHILAWGESHPVKDIKNYAENRRIELEYSIQNVAANDTQSPLIH